MYKYIYIYIYIYIYYAYQCVHMCCTYVFMSVNGEIHNSYDLYNITNIVIIVLKVNFTILNL